MKQGLSLTLPLSNSPTLPFEHFISRIFFNHDRFKKRWHCHSSEGLIGLPGQHGQGLRRLSDAQGVLVQHVDGGHKETGSCHVVRVEVTVGDGTEQVVVLPGQTRAADGYAHLVHKPLQWVDVHLQDKTWARTVRMTATEETLLDMRPSSQRCHCKGEKKSQFNFQLLKM